LFNVGDNEHVVGAAKIDESDEAEDAEAANGDTLTVEDGNQPALD
jgi:hypothetical protein